MTAPKKEKGAGQGAPSNVNGGQAETSLQNDQQANHTPISDTAANAKSDEKDAKAKRSRSTSTEAQIAKLKAFLREGPKSTHFLRSHGISHPAGRVLDLRGDGFEILTQRVRTVDDNGYSHINAAEYVLLREPPQQMPLPGVSNG